MTVMGSASGGNMHGKWRDTWKEEADFIKSVNKAGGRDIKGNKVFMPLKLSCYQFKIDCITLRYPM